MQYEIDWSKDADVLVEEIRKELIHVIYGIAEIQYKLSSVMQLNMSNKVIYKACLLYWEGIEQGMEDKKVYYDKENYIVEEVEDNPKYTKATEVITILKN